jgi:FkbH-like protein
MKYFVFRNHTVESFFPGGEYAFSGYDDISVIPDDADGYIWCYQVPVQCDLGIFADEIRSYVEKMRFTAGRITASKPLLLFTLCDWSSVPLTGNDARASQAVSAYNAAIGELVQIYSNARRVDFSTFTRNYTASDLMDWKYWFLSQMPVNPKLAKVFHRWFQRQLDQIALRRRKCLVLDLDNTLWGGVLGEDGMEGIRIGGDYPGKAFHYFQEALLELGRSGIILTVCSKNNEADVLEAWERHPDMILRREYFAAWRINWTDKATNIREIARELNIGLDSMVFVDDNPTERELIRQTLPMVGVPEFPAQPYGLPAFFAELVEEYFKVYTVTDEDRHKTEQYKANAQRAQVQGSFTDFGAFLESLQMRLTVAEADAFSIPRIAQMTQKTNQFNLTTRRYTEADIKGKMEADARIYTLSVSDRFGDSGITGCIIIEDGEIDTLLLSCRILGKGIETAFVRTVQNRLLAEGISHLKATYIPTAKNGQVTDFYDRCGFTLTETLPDGTKHYLTEWKVSFEIEPYYQIIEK